MDITAARDIGKQPQHPRQRVLGQATYHHIDSLRAGPSLMFSAYICISTFTLSVLMSCQILLLKHRWEPKPSICSPTEGGTFNASFLRWTFEASGGPSGCPSSFLPHCPRSSFLYAFLPASSPSLSCLDLGLRLL